MNYKTKGLEMLMYKGVHPDSGSQHPSWERTWVPIKDVVGCEDYDYRGLGYVYFVDYMNCEFYCFESLERAKDYFSGNCCVWVKVSCHTCYRIDEPEYSW